VDVLYVDSDADGLTDEEEIETYGTDPTDYDTDDDGLSDGFEIQSRPWKTTSALANPLVSDSGCIRPGGYFPDQTATALRTVKSHQGTFRFVADFDRDGMPDGSNSRWAQPLRGGVRQRCGFRRRAGLVRGAAHTMFSQRPILRDATVTTMISPTWGIRSDPGARSSRGYPQIQIQYLQHQHSDTEGDGENGYHRLSPG